MTDWKHTLNFTFLLDKKNTVEGCIDKSKKVLERFQKNTPEFKDSDELQQIIEEFSCAEDVDDFDAAMDNLYDFSDDHLIWIKTEF